MLKIVEIISINNESEYFKFDFKKNMTEIKNELKENIGVNINEQLWFLNNIMMAVKIYNPTIKGTILLDTLAIRLIPPNMTMPTNIATKIPVKKFPIKILF